MKKVIIPVVLLTIVAFAAYKFLLPKNKVEHHKEIPLTVSTNDSLNGEMGGALQEYYNMKDAFTKSDTTLANKEASGFVGKLALVKTDEINADTSIIQLAKQLQQSLTAETNTLISATSIEAKRKSFQVVSDGLFDLLRTIGYKGSKVYQLFCPMAFDQNGAAWLSNSSEIVNPYFGEKMIHCGDLRDSINIAK